MWFDWTSGHDSRAGRRGVRRRSTGSTHEGLEDRRLLSFAPAVAYAAGDHPLAVVTADFNGDGRQDVATANYAGGGVSVLLSNGDGTFQPALNTGVSPGIHSVSAGDFNNDGKNDLLTANWQGLGVLLGNGNGTFQPALNVALPSQVPAGYEYVGALPQAARSVAVGDLNSDGKLDVAATGSTSFTILTGGYWGYYYEETVTHTYVNVLLGHGNGTLAAQSARPVDNTTYDLAVADLNNDARPDVVTSHYGSATAMLGNGDGTLQAPLDSGTGHSPLALGDFDGDGKVDLAMRGFDNRSINVNRGNGDGTFGAPESLGAGQFSQYLGRIVVGDVNGDGKLDLTGTLSDTSASYGPYGAYDRTSRDHAVVLLGNGDGSFALPVTSPLATYPEGFNDYDAALADFNGDGRPDLVMTHEQDDAVLVALNDGNWVAAPRPPLLNIGDAAVTEGTPGSVNATFTVTLSRASAQTVTVQYAANSGTAISGKDFTATAGTLTFLPGETSKTVVVPVTGDATDEYDEGFTVDLSSAGGADVADGQGAGTIADDDAPPEFVIGDVSRREGRKGSTRFDFTVSLSAPSEKYTAVSYATANGTAAAGSDYLAASGTLYFAPGETTKVVSVNVLADRAREATESFFVTLSFAVEAGIGDGQGVGTILDDDQHGKK